ncbi:MAG: hypothetical protein AAF368_03200, partial [Planctomycetota bacterium]
MTLFMPLGTRIFHTVQPELRAALERGDAEALTSLCDLSQKPVVQIPLLPPEACEALLAEIEKAQREGPPVPPNSMHQAGHVLGDEPFTALFAEMLAHWVQPLATAFLPEFGRNLQSVYGYLVHYERGQDEFLGWHVDDSDVTLNLCLGDDFSGSEIYFTGLRCERHRQGGWSEDEEFEIDHRPGTAILHAGPHRHGVRDLRRGRRRNLILWCKGERTGAPNCPPWCGA